MSAVSDALSGPDDPNGVKTLYPCVPATCMICGARYSGGHQLPGLRMKAGLRVFYHCGASLSVWKDLGDGCFQLLLKNCHCDENNEIYEKYMAENPIIPPLSEKGLGPENLPLDTILEQPKEGE